MAQGEGTGDPGRLVRDRTAVPDGVVAMLAVSQSMVSRIAGL
jgi:hypothetical protein